MSELKNSLFGYNKKSVDNLIEEIKHENQKAIKREKEAYEARLSEYERRLQSMEAALTEAHHKLNPVIRENENLKDKNDALNDDYSTVINNYNDMRRDIIAYRSIIESKNHEIEELQSKLYKSENRYDSFIQVSKQASADMVRSGNLFDEKLAVLKDCLSQMSQICADTETMFNEVYQNIANIILFEFAGESQSEHKNTSDDQKVS